MRKNQKLSDRMIFDQDIKFLKDEFYVYTFTAPDGHLFYIGKGKGERFKQHFLNYRLKHNSPKNSKIKSVVSGGGRVQVDFVAKGLTEFESLNLERILIDEYGLKEDGGQLLNLRYGSFDSAGLWTESRKQAHSVRLRGNCARFTEDQVKKAKLLVHYFGYSYSDICKLPEYNSCKPGTIHSWCAGNSFSYVSPHLKTIREITKEKSEEVINLWLKGQFTKKEISNILGINYPSVIQYIKNYEQEVASNASSKTV